MAAIEENIKQAQHDGSMKRDKAHHKHKMETKEQELALDKKIAAFETEKQRMEAILNKEKQLGQLELLEKRAAQEHQQRLQKMEAEQQQQDIKLKNDMADLKIKQERSQQAYQEQSRKQELYERKQDKELEMQMKTKEAMQKHEHLDQSHALDLKIKEQQQKFDNKLKRDKTEHEMKLDEEFSKKAKAKIKLETPEGRTAQIQFSNDLNPQLADIFFRNMLQGGAANQPAIESAPGQPQATTNEPPRFNDSSNFPEKKDHPKAE